MFDLDRIGMMGHSLGGVAVFQAAQEDPRVHCAVLLDASLQLPDFERPAHFPLLNVRQESASLNEVLQTNMRELVARAYAQGQQRLYDCLQSARSFVKIEGADHMSFSTIPALFGANDTLTRAQELML